MSLMLKAPAAELIIIIVVITIFGTASAVIGIGHFQALSAPMITTHNILEPILAAVCQRHSLSSHSEHPMQP